MTFGFQVFPAIARSAARTPAGEAKPFPSCTRRLLALDRYDYTITSDWRESPGLRSGAPSEHYCPDAPGLEVRVSRREFIHRLRPNAAASSANRRVCGPRRVADVIVGTPQCRILECPAGAYPSF